MADYGICIGIDGYPGLNDLHGPCNDAAAFKEWLLQPAKGGLDEANVSSLISRELQPVSPDIRDARPLQSELEDLFYPFVEAAAQQQHLGRRLFIFVAGHGFADPVDMNSAALYAANARKLFAANLAVSEYVHFLRRHWVFDEIILVMDACRSTSAFHQIGAPPLPVFNSHANAHKVKMFLGYGAAFNQVTREKDIEGQTRGIFTTAVLDALENAPANRNGRVTGTQIKDYIHNIINGISGTDTASTLAIEADDRKDVFFIGREYQPDQQQQPKFDVNFDVADRFLNHNLTIEAADGTEISQHLITTNQFTLALAQGYFKAHIDILNFHQLIEVPGNVTLNS